MGDQPAGAGRRLTAFLDALPDATGLALVKHLGDGLWHASRATECVTRAGARQRHQTTAHLLAHLSTAIDNLEAAREIVRTEGQVAR